MGHKNIRLKAYLLLDNKLPTSKLPTGWQTGKQYTVINVTTGTSMCKNITQEWQEMTTSTYSDKNICCICCNVKWNCNVVAFLMYDWGDSVIKSVWGGRDEKMMIIVEKLIVNFTKL